MNPPGLLTSPTIPISIPKPTTPISIPKPTAGVADGRLTGITNVDTLIQTMNLTFFPALLNFIASQRYIPKTKCCFREEYDYIIVGGGAAGSVVANRLSEKECCSVLVLEAGRVPPIWSEIPGVARGLLTTDVNWGFYSVPQKCTGKQQSGNKIPFDAGKALGGSSIVNAMLFIRGNKCDYDDWEEMGATGWSYKDVLPYFLKLENNTNPDIGNAEYHNVGGPVTASRVRYYPEFKQPILDAHKSLGYKIVDPNGPEQLGVSDYQAFIRNGQRCSMAKAYLVPADDRPNLDIITEAFVKKIRISNHTAVGVYFDYKGRHHYVKARKEVILSAGAINTPKILILSGVGPLETLEKFDIPVKANLPVGKNLQDHPTAVMMFSVNHTIQPYLLKLMNPKYIAEYQTNRSGPLASSCGVFSLGFHRSEDAATKECAPNYETYFTEGANLVARLTFGLTSVAYEKLFHPYELSATLWCFSSVLNAKSRGCVTIKSRDPYEPPEIDPRYFEDEQKQDMIDVVAGMKHCLKVANMPAVKEAGVKPFKTLMPGCEEYVNNQTKYLECYAEAFIFSIAHQSCTARMGNINDSTTVVDPKLRVKGIENLRVVDASVMPKVVSGNTMIPTVMIAEKASDMIKETINC